MKHKRVWAQLPGLMAPPSLVFVSFLGQTDASLPWRRGMTFKHTQGKSRPRPCLTDLTGKGATKHF